MPWAFRVSGAPAQPLAAIGFQLRASLGLKATPQLLRVAPDEVCASRLLSSASLLPLPVLTRARTHARKHTLALALALALALSRAR